MASRDLTYDEKKAAESAFRGLPPDPGWSSAARTVYEGLVKVLLDGPGQRLHGLSGAKAEQVDDGEEEPDHSFTPHDDPQSPVKHAVRVHPVSTQSQRKLFSRDQAIKAGILVDVTAQAFDMGLPLPVGLTKPMWEEGIAGSGKLGEHEQQTRLRDILMALRLHLSRSSLILPVSQFPALLTIPPDPMPQICRFVAVVQSDGPYRHSLLLLLPNELSGLSSPRN